MEVALIGFWMLIGCLWMPYALMRQSAEFPDAGWCRYSFCMVLNFVLWPVGMAVALYRYLRSLLQVTE